MSQMPALARPSTRVPRRNESPRPARPTLRVVPTAPRAPRRLPFVLLCSVLLAAGLMGLLFLNIQLAQGSYALHSLQSRSTQLEEQAGMLREDLAGASSPANLADRALKLGMVPGAAPAFLRLPDGQVLGVPQPAPAPSAKASPSSSAGGVDTGAAEGGGASSAASRTDASTGAASTGAASRTPARSTSTGSASPNAPTATSAPTQR